MRSAGVIATAHRHIQIRQAVASVLPPALGAVCQVAKADQLTLVLAVPSAAHAAKLRQMAPSLIRALGARGWNLNEIAVRVQAGLPTGRTEKPRPVEKNELDETALQAFSRLHQGLRPGPLADAVARLLRHHGKAGGQD
ncbi:DciA family protein [Orrella sp. JC864]|uniref:DciA family protein n=1 Tax=Orrella sp. JC864 TaxID=3120298 RepID=UPI0012BD767D